MENPRFIAIVGPTASGKTALSLEVGRRLGGEVVSMDSRQIYRGMDIGTGKVSLWERGILPHHGLDLRDPDERYSAGQFARDAREWVSSIRGRGRVPLLVGGTGFFLRALMEPMFSQPDLDPDRLDRLRGFLNRLPEEELRSFRWALDPGPDQGNSGGDRQRLSRRVEMALLTGRPLSWWHQEGETAQQPIPGLVTLLDLPRDLLYQRINSRVGRMVEEGLVEEVEGLLKAGFGAHDPGMTGAGYREIIGYIRGELSLEEATEEIRRSHRRYARRQITWFKHQLPPKTLVLDGTRPFGELAEEVKEAWATVGTGALGGLGRRMKG